MMMKRLFSKYSLCFVVMLMGMIMPNEMLAYTGVSTVPTRNSGAAATDANTFFLYNVGTGKFINSGGHWGTEVQLEASGLALWYTSNKINTNGKDFGYVSGRTVADDNGVFVDQSTYLYFVSLGNNQFAIRTDNRNNSTYLVQLGAVDETVVGTSREYIVTGKAYTNTSSLPDAAKWLVVTREEMKSSFTNAEKPGNGTIDCTFFISDQGFSREVGNGSEWTVENIASNGYYRKGNSVFLASTTSAGTAEVDYEGRPVFNPTGSVNEDAANKYLEAPEYNLAKSSSTNTFTVDGETFEWLKDNGRNYHIQQKDIDGRYTALALNSDVCYNSIYGGFYNGRIKGATGNIYQEFAPARAGWYQISCDGYIYGEGNANLYARQTVDVNDMTIQSQSKELVSEEEYLTMTQAGIAFFNNGNVSKYRQSVMIYVDANKTVRLGIEITGGNSETITEFDDFRIEYAGNQDNILLNEMESSIDYLIDQVDANAAHTLQLKRKFVVNQWNSLCLPVKLTNKQITDAFGGSVEVCKLGATKGNVIYFNKVDLAANSDIIEPGRLYLIKPSSLNAKTAGTFYVDSKDHSSYSFEATESSPVYTIPTVTLKTIPDAVFEDINPTPTTEEQDLIFCGSYVYLDGTESGVAPNSYVLNSNSGEWIHWVGTSNLSVKGFRTWISVKGNEPGQSGGDTPGEVDPGDIGSKLFIYIDGEEETTAIEGLTVPESTIAANSSMYSVSGQKVANANNLTKGIYIINGKKFIVK